MSKANGYLLRPDTWMGDMLDRDAYQLIIPEADGVPDEAVIQSLSRPNVFAFCKVPVTRPPAIQVVEGLHFNLIDTNVTLSRALSGNFEETNSNGIEFGFAEASDAKDTGLLAEQAFIYTRFHLDPAVSNEASNRLKRAWVENYFTGSRGEHMVLARSNKQVVGFLQLLSRDDVLIIDLIATHPDYRRMGIADNMIRFAARNLRDHQTYRVGTQLANVPSIRLYQKMGFLLEEAKYVFHYHGPQ